ncbi:PQQ-dependent dehydrogenase, methanol/ethanol family [Paraflavisolibacter sp. H34]|uniref:PQQ-dependent dehydrogenase, methanol/ethanol family n=1 Tax=Huijunlia imazamoxiresistens TaxID=3127457 RepID=UPI0030178021
MRKIFFLLCTGLLAACGSKKSVDADDALLAAAADHPGEWLTHGLNYNEDRCSRLTQVTKENVHTLGLAWTTNLESKRGLEATPLVADGVMYLTGVWSTVFALDAATGKLLWKYDPKVPAKTAEKLCCDVVNRGVALYKGKIYSGTLDGRLIALDAATGKLDWEVMTVDTTKPYSITGAPRIIDGKVLIGNGGAEFGVRGYIAAYDPGSGKQVWRFYTVPGDPSKPFENKAMEAAAKTWAGQWWKYGGGGTAWDAIAYDPELKLMYVGTGNGSPWNRKYRSDGKGDNLYLSSILAINPANGELVWYYQTTPGDSWDFTAAQHIILADMDLNGQKRKVLMQAPKNGFFYVIDRTNGKFISGDPFVYTNWAKRIDSTGRPVEEEGVHYETVNTDISPNYNGGHNWHPMAYNPKLNLVYIPARENASVYGHDPNWKYNEKSFGTGNGWNLASDPNPAVPTRNDPATKKMPRGMLIAWNPALRKEVWRVPQASDWNGGVLATATDLVFQGTAQGDFIAYDGSNGKELWKVNLGGGIIAPPVSYELGGKQYISVAAGWGGGYGMKKKFAPLQNGRVYTFVLNGNTALPTYRTGTEPALPLARYTATPAEVAHGSELFNRYCATCHVINEGGGGVAPDLGFSLIPTTPEGFRAIVHQGGYQHLGMPRFGDRLGEGDVEHIRKYILTKAREGKPEPPEDTRYKKQDEQ